MNIDKKHINVQNADDWYVWKNQIFKSVYNIKLTNNTIGNYINWFEESFLLNKVLRYDIQRKAYIKSPYKIYFEDIGIRNAILNFRDIDETDLIENIVYNELRYRGYNVDVGVVSINEKTDRIVKILWRLALNCCKC